MHKIGGGGVGVVTEKQTVQAKKEDDEREVATEREPEVHQYITEEDKRCLNIVKDNRAIFLDRLQSLELLASFLEVENETNPKA